MAYPEGLLTSGERVREHLRPHARMLVVPAVLPPVVAGVGMWLAALATGRSWHGTAWIALAVLGVLLVGRFSVTPALRWWCTHLVVTDRRLLVREGVVSRSGIDVAGSSITGVRTRQRGLERFLGCGTLVVCTRDAADEPWEFHGIPHLAHTAALVGAVAEERGGRRDPYAEGVDGFDAPDEFDDEPDDGFELDDGFDDLDELDDDGILDAELVDDEDEPDDEPDVPVRTRRSVGRTSR